MLSNEESPEQPGVLTTEHELYISVGLKKHAAMKPSIFKDLVDTLLFENIGYMQSWGTHTKNEYIGIIDKQHATIEELKEEVERYRTALEDIAARTASTIIESIAIDALEGNNLA